MEMLERFYTETDLAKPLMEEFATTMWSTAPLVVLSAGVILFLFSLLLLLGSRRRSARIHDLTKQVESLRTKSQDEKKTDAAEIERLVNAIQAQEDEVAELTKEQKRVEQSLKQAEQAVSEWSEALKKEQAKVLERDARIEELDRVVLDAHTDLSNTRREAASELEARKATLHSGIADLSESLGLLENQNVSAASRKIAEALKVFGTLGNS